MPRWRNAEGLERRRAAAEMPVFAPLFWLGFMTDKFSYQS